jgi:hypothetical protein
MLDSTIKNQASDRLFYITTVLCLSYACIFITSIFLQKQIYLVQFFHFGLDQIDFLHASRDVIMHQDPYLRDRFVTPPLSVFINFPLISLDDYSAAVIFFITNIVLTLGSIYITQRACELVLTQRLAIMLLSLISAPTLMLFERGNIDGIVAIFVAVMLLQIRRPIISGVLLGTAILIKVYPLILVFPLLIQRHYRAVIVCVATILIAFFGLTHLFVSFFSTLVSRVSINRLSENLSFFAFFFEVNQHLFAGGTSHFAGAILKCTYYGSLFLILAMGIWCDINTARRNTLPDYEARAIMSSYLVFTVNIPGLVYLYTGIMVIILLIYFCDTRIQLGRNTSRMLCIGCILLFIPARSFNLTVGADNISNVVNFLPPLGSAMLLAFFVCLKIDALRNGSASSSCSTCRFLV